MEYCTSQQLHAMDKIIGNIKITGSHIKSEERQVPWNMPLLSRTNALENVDSLMAIQDKVQITYEIIAKTFQHKEKEAMLSACKDFISRRNNDNPDAYVEFLALEEEELGVVLELGLEEYRRKYGDFKDSFILQSR